MVHFNTTHGDSKIRLYRIWTGLKHRRYTTYKPTVCKEWNSYIVFKNWALKNGYKDDLTIDRINNRIGYHPSNCQWLTHQHNAGKDKKLLTPSEESYYFIERQELQLTQRRYAKLKSVSRNTIQRLEKRMKYDTIR